MKKNKIILKVIIAILTLFIILSFNIFVNAEDVDSSETTLSDPANPKGNFHKIGETEAWMPASSNNDYGIVPQYVEGKIHRTVKLPRYRWDLTKNEWTATIDGNTVFCSWYNHGIKRSSFDEKTYFLEPNKGVTLADGKTRSISSGTRMSTLITNMKSNIDEFVQHFNYGSGDATYQNVIWKWENTGCINEDSVVPSVVATSWTTTESSITWDDPDLAPTTDKIGWLIYDSAGTTGLPDSRMTLSNMAVVIGGSAADIWAYNEETTEAQAEEQAKKYLEDIFHTDDIDYDALGIDTVTVMTKRGKETVPAVSYIAPVSAAHGPAWMVPEFYPDPPDTWVPDDKDEYDDERVRGWKRTRVDEYKNDWYSFIFSSSENAYGNPTYATRYTLDDIQWAYWELLHDPECTSAASSSKEPELRTAELEATSLTDRSNGVVLYQKAKEYKKFIDEYSAASYESSISIDDSEAQVIVNRTDKQYILGPYSLNYKSIPDISYVKGIQIDYGSGVLEYSELNNTIELVMESGGTESSNGMLKKYPGSGEKFFVIIDANQIGLDTTSLKLKAIFEYINESYARFEKFESELHTYRYGGYYLVNGEVTAEDTEGDLSGSEEGDACGVDHKMAHGKMTITVKYTQGKGQKDGPPYGEHGTHVVDDSDPDNIVYCYELANEDKEIVYSFDVYAPYIKMLNKIWSEDEAQELTNIGPHVADGDDSSGDGSGDVGGSDNAYRKYKIVSKSIDINLAMELGGYVWADAELGGKETGGDGLCDITVKQLTKDDKDDPTEFELTYDASKDKRVPNVKVILYRTLNETSPVQKKVMYTYDGETIRGDEPKTLDGEVIELTLGEYRFTQLSPMYEYYVAFEYNGQYYEPTTYTSPADEENGWGKLQENENKSDDQIENCPVGNWEYNSNATDIRTERAAYNEMFGTINSYEKNYTKDGKDKPTFTRMELLGYTLQQNGKYTPTPKYADDDPEELYPLPTDSGVVDRFGNLLPQYETYTGTDKKGKMITFVKDCRMAAYTGENVDIRTVKEKYNIDYYPYTKGSPKIFVIDNYISDYTSILGDRVTNLVYPEGPIYDSAYFINLGLHERPTVDISVNMDVEKVTMEINNHVHEYDYNKCNICTCADCGWSGLASDLKLEVRRPRTPDEPTPRYALCCPSCGKENISTFFGIEARLSEGYYNRDYTRDVHKSDYGYKVSDYGTPDTYGRSKADELEIFVTYKIDVTNASMSIKARIDELVDYYDETYIPVPERSYIQIQNGDKAGNKYPIVISDEYDKTSKCKSPDMTDNMIYIRGIGKADENGFYLTAGQIASFYVTFRVDKFNRDGEDWVKLGEKDNLVELNGYSTRYEVHTIIPNDYDKPGTPDDTVTAGLIDFNSTPGNQDKDEAYTKWIVENDADKAPTLNLKLNDNDDENRVISGFVWEDTRDNQVTNLYATTGNGKVDSGEDKVDGVTVQLVELLENGTEFIWREFGNGDKSIPFGNYQIVSDNGTTVGGSGNPTIGLEETPIIQRSLPLNESGDYLPQVENYKFTSGNVKGAYAFKSFIPGNYIVRFIYGDTVKTVLPTSLSVSGDANGQNATSYNGQDYKSTSYQVAFDQKETVLNAAGEEVKQNITYNWRLTPIKATRTKNVDGTYTYTPLTDDTVKNWVYVYKLHDSSGNIVYYPVYNDIGERQEAPILTEISTFKDDATNNETLTLFDASGNLLRDVISSNEYDLSTNKNNAKLPVTSQNGYLYAITESEQYNGSSAPNISDAKDIYHDAKRPTEAEANAIRQSARLNSREDVIDYSDNNIVNHIAEVLASSRADYPLESDVDNEEYKDAYSSNRKELLKELMKYTQMTAETGLIVVEFEYDSVSTEDGDVARSYKIENVNLGLEERPKSQLLLNKEVTNVKVTLANGSILFDTNSVASNVLWRDHTAYKPEYERNVLVRVDEQRENESTNIGYIQLTMDEEIMHGATLKVDYNLTVTNAGEVDYNDKQFYYNSAKDRIFEKVDASNVVKTKADNVIDYVAKNLQFYAKDNEGYWESIPINGENGVFKSDSTLDTKNFVNASLKSKVSEYNTIIKTDKLNKELIPSIFVTPDDSDSEVSVPLVLTQLITSENSTDDLTYRNIAEIVETSNDVGRRMDNSVVGNQNPTTKPGEVDTDTAEIIRILPPFGETAMYLVISIIAIISIGIIIISIVFIKKKILK